MHGTHMKSAMQGTAFATALRWFVRVLLYGTFIELLLAGLYALGNFQRFSDATQSTLVDGLQRVSSVVSGGVVVAFVLTIGVAVAYRQLRLAKPLVGIVGMGVVSVSLLLGSTAIATLTSVM